MPIYFNPETGQFVPIYDDAAESMGMGFDRASGPEPEPAMPQAPPPPAPVTAMPQAPEPEPAPADVSFEPDDFSQPPAPPQPAGPLTGVSYGQSRTYTPGQAPVLDYGDQSAQQAVTNEAQADIRNTQGRIRANETQQAQLSAGFDETQRQDAETRSEMIRLRSEALAQNETEIQAARDAVPQADPGRVFRDMSGFSKGILLIAGALNGMNVRFNRGRNGIAEALNQIADRDMAAQKMNIDTAREDVFRAERSYDRKRSNLDVGIQDHDLGAIQRLEGFKRKVSELMSNTSSEVSLAKLNEVYTGLEQAQLDRSTQRTEKLYQSRYNAWEAGKVNERFYAGQRFQAEQARLEREGKVKPPEDTVFAQSPFNQRDIEVGVALPDGEAKAVREGYGKTSNLLVKAHRYLRLRQRIGRKYRGLGDNLRNIGDEEKQELDQAAGEVFYAIRKDATGAAASKQEDDVVRAIQGAPDGYLNASTLAATTGLVKSLTEERRVMHTTYKMRYADDKKPVDVYEETQQPKDIDLTASANPLNDSKDAMITLMSTENVDEGISALSAMTDYLDSSGTKSTFLPGVVAGAFRRDDGGVDVTEAQPGKHTAFTRVEAASKIRTQAMRLAALAKRNGKTEQAKEILAEADRFVKALKDPTDYVGDAEAKRVLEEAEDKANSANPSPYGLF